MFIFLHTFYLSIKKNNKTGILEVLEKKIFFTTKPKVGANFTEFLKDFFRGFYKSVVVFLWFLEKKSKKYLSFYFYHHLREEMGNCKVCEGTWRHVQTV